MTDGELVRRTVAGESAAYGELARRWYYRILAFCQARLMTSQIHDAEDLVQEVLIRGFADLDSLSNPENFGAWLRGVAKHVCVDWIRHRQRIPRIVPVDAASADSLSVTQTEIIVASDERAVVLQEIAAIPEDLREAILLHYYEDLTYDQMAQWLGVARATVNERLARARALLRIRLSVLRSDL